MTALLYALFFLSGAAALVYEVVWGRALSLVFGGSHLAVTTVLFVFMGGLALGSHLVGRLIHRWASALRFYAALEIGIALSALAFVGLIRIYPALYVPLARGADDRTIYLSFVRVTLSVLALIVPTTFMGGTLPVLSHFVAARSGRLGQHLSFLYGFNTMGAVAGALAAGFLLLPACGVNGALAVAIATNLAVGIAAALVPAGAAFRRETGPAEPLTEGPRLAASGARSNEPRASSCRFILWGIGMSGFCALGYEVLWTRILSMVVGTSVYGFAIMLAAFLTGLSLGGYAYGAWLRARGGAGDETRSVALFAVVQVLIGAAALAVTYFLGDVPAYNIRLQGLLAGSSGSEYLARQGASFVLAFGFMSVPAFFMGIAFPLAGTIYARRRSTVAGAVGAVAAYNTVGAISGAAASGFALIYLFGIERSLQLLSLVNVGTGLWIAANLARSKVPRTAAALAAFAACLALAWDPDWGRAWDRKYLAIFRNNQRAAFNSSFKIQDALENTDVLYYHEGANETVSVIRPRGAEQAFIVNGRVEASTTPADIQCQRTLGHLPMLLHPDPRRVFVLGLGTGMTLGATSIHPEVEEITLAEIERGVVGVARTFREWNHDVLDDPRLRIVFNDGRNFLTTTEENFDVITADPIHPWSGGAAYLYTREYYEIAADRLRPGGVACQWLPIYELSVKDVQTVVKTFQEAFRYTMLWLTHYDAEIVGSNHPIEIDEARLARRFEVPSVARDMASVEMGSVSDFLSYFAMGTEGLRAFARPGIVNTDSNLYIEFSAPRSMGIASLMGDNVRALSARRESLSAYLASGASGSERAAGRRMWDTQVAVARAYDMAHALLLDGHGASEEFGEILGDLQRRYPDYAPGRHLMRERQRMLAGIPRLLDSVRFEILSESGRRLVEISAVGVRIGESRAAVMFVDNAAREIYAQKYIDGEREEIDGLVERFSTEAMTALRELQRRESALAIGHDRPVPSGIPTLEKARDLLDGKCRGEEVPALGSREQATRRGDSNGRP